MVDYPMSQNPGSRESPVSFRPGKLRTAIGQRTVRTMTEGQVAKRDLARYYLLIGQAPLDGLLTRREAVWLAKTDFQLQNDELLSGDPFIPEHEDPSDYLLRVVRYPIARAERQGRPATDLAYQVADKIEGMTPLQRAALVDALDRLPTESEEAISDVNNWALIGIRLADDPLTTKDVLSENS